MDVRFPHSLQNHAEGLRIDVGFSGYLHEHSVMHDHAALEMGPCTSIRSIVGFAEFSVDRSSLLRHVPLQMMVRASLMALVWASLCLRWSVDGAPYDLPFPSGTVLLLDKHSSSGTPGGAP